MFAFIMLFVVPLLLVLHRVNSAQPLPQSEYLALYDLYNAANGVDWKWSDKPLLDGIPWEFSPIADPCGDNWQGVFCEIVSTPLPATYHISELQLSQMNLTGYLPSSLEDLVELALLDVGLNALTSSIPATFCNWKQMFKLKMENNQLSGPIPGCINRLTSLTSLYLQSNLLTGSIPHTVGSISPLMYLWLNSNELNGTIPDTVCNLRALLELDLYSNHLSGSIPTCIGALAALETLELFYNALTGPIPQSICNLTQLTSLSLNNNNLQSHIPACIGSLSALTDVYLQYNALTGPIPDSIGNLSQVLLLEMQYNALTGSIPASIGNLSQVQSLLLMYNRLSGRIPATIGGLSTLQNINVMNNFLTGWIPVEVGNLLQLQHLYVQFNLLSGPIPSSIGNLTDVTNVCLHFNALTGQIPDAFGDATALLQLYVNHNCLTGTLPASLANLPALFDLQVNDNRLTGPLPDAFGQLRNLEYIYAYSNLLTGTMPSWLGSLPKLQYIDLYDNLLTGWLPDMSSLRQLTSLTLQGNRLTGPLTGAFSTEQINLVEIILDDNEFTGELPAVLFALPRLQTISIVGSCMHGTLPSNVCNATFLEALILYGLTTGTSCRAQGVQSLSQSQHTFGGAFPSCLLSKPNMVTLLLSSNGLTGSIASNITVVNTLIELDLSHNDLTGSIPSGIQTHGFALLDLSHNKLSGVLQPNLRALSNASALFVGNASTMSPGQVVSLSSNRLSGPVPSSLMPLHNNLSVLAGNLFECKYDKSDLPQHDSDISNYQCASNSFDIAIYVWLGLGASALAVTWVAFSSDRLPTLSAVLQLPDALSTRLAHLHTLLEQYSTIYKWGWYCAAFCVTVLLPYYAIVSHYEGTHTHKYAYVLSAIYVSGVAPFVVDVLLLIVLMSLVCCVVQWRDGNVQRPVPSAKGDEQWVRTYVRCIFAFTNLTVVLGANVAFVYVILYQSTQLQTLAQVLLSLFKLSWTAVVAPYLIQKLDAHFSTQDDGKLQPFFTLQLLVSLFNNIAIPCLVVAAIDPNCFSNILLPPQPETVGYLLPSCDLATVTGTCTEPTYAPALLQFTPPFTYSYQCSASFITSYAPTFIYMSMSTVFLSPLLQYVLLRLHERLPAGSTVHKLISRIVPRMLKQPAVITATASRVPRSIVGAVGILVTLLTQLGILLTFGAIFPPVALAMAVSISAVVFMTRYKVQRYVHTVVETQQLPVLDMINAECERVGTREQMRTAVVIIICYCCAFYAMFLFDTLGDAVGFDASVWVLFVVPLAPFVVFVSIALYTRYTLITASSTATVVDVELTNVMTGISEEQQEASHTVNVLHTQSV